MPGECRQAGSGAFGAGAGGMRMGSVPVLRGQPAEQAGAARAAQQEGGFAPYARQIALKVVLRGGAVALDIIDKERQSAQAQGRHGQRGAAHGERSEELPREGQEPAERQAGEQPDGDGLVPQRQTKQEAAGGERTLAAVLEEADQKKQAADEQQML